MTYDSSMPISMRNETTASPANDLRALARQRLIVALDVPDAASAAALVDRLEGTCSWFKVGLELFVASGPAVLEPLLNRGHSVFLDLKLHDIPNTVAGAVRSASALGVRMMTVHAAGGPAMLAAARGALEGVTNPPELLAVTVLTSMDQPQVNAIGLSRTPAEQVELLARMGLEAGIRGFVCSADTGDQKRIATPAEALRMGANYLVVGRPITQALDPAKVAAAILDEMAAVL